MPSRELKMHRRVSSLRLSDREADALASWRRQRQHASMSSSPGRCPTSASANGPADEPAIVHALNPSSQVAVRDFQTRDRITSTLVAHHHERVRSALAYHDARAANELHQLQREADAARLLMSSKQQHDRSKVETFAHRSLPLDLHDDAPPPDAVGNATVAVSVSDVHRLPPQGEKKRIVPTALSPELQEILNRHRRSATPPFVVESHVAWSVLPRLRSPTSNAPKLRRFLEKECADIDAAAVEEAKHCAAARRRQNRSISSLSLVTTENSRSKRMAASLGGSSRVAAVPTLRQLSTVDRMIRKPRPLPLGAPPPRSFSYWDAVNAIPLLK